MVNNLFKDYKPKYFSRHNKSTKKDILEGNSYRLI